MVTRNPKLKGVTDLRYFWYADNYPLTWGTSNTYKITEAEAGKEIRCMVKAVGALDAPEARSTPSNSDERFAGVIPCAIAVAIARIPASLEQGYDLLQ